MSKTRILVVDDDPKLSRLVAVILTRVGGYDVREENRSFAVAATAREYMPHLILLDVVMPGQDGGGVFAVLQADPVLSQIPVVFLTSLVSRSETGLRNGIRYLSKPVDPEVLLDTVRSLCPRYQPEAA